jgi:LacI family gluconate utilization system Gnt-I transcriptional repressor
LITQNVTGNITKANVYCASEYGQSCFVWGVSLISSDDSPVTGKLAEPTKRAQRRKLVGYTIHDIAALAGVSSITVSRYFREPDKVSPAMRERLRAVIADTGYVPSQVAGRLASGRSRMVGAVMQNTASATFADLVRGLGDGMEEGEQQLLLANTDYSQLREARAVQAFAGWHPSALILTRDDHTPDAEALLRGMRAPVVEAWGVVPGRPFHQVGFPHREVGVQLTQHFLQQGARRIRFALRNAAEDFRAQQRAEGYQRAMQAAGLVPDIVWSDFDDEFEAGVDILQRFSAEPVQERPQAIVFAGDNMAAGAIFQASNFGLKLPDDCAIAGFGGAKMSAWLQPGLTTLKPDPYQIGLRAAQLVRDLLARDPEEDCPPEIHEVPCTLLVRESSRVVSGRH